MSFKDWCRGSRARTAMALALSLVPASLVHAQEPATPLPAPPTATTDANAASAATALPEVVVTANKRSESVREVPGTVTVLTGNKLSQLGATSFQDYATYVPGLSSNSAGTGENQVVIRGVTSGSAFSTTVGIYVDESPVGSSSSFAGGLLSTDVNVYDMSRLEVLSGPQGTLYGSSTLGGLIKYVTAPPDLRDLGFTVQGEGSHTDSGELNHSERAALNLPIISGHLALRVDGFAENDAGYIDNPARGLQNVNSSRTRGGRVSLLGEVFPGLTIRLSAIQQKIDRNGAGSVDIDRMTREPVAGRYDQTSFFAEPFKNQLILYSGVAKWKFGWGELTSASSWQYNTVFTAADSTPALGGDLMTGNTIPYLVDLRAFVKKFTQEVRFASSIGKWLDYQVGGYFTLEHADLQTPVYGYTDYNGSILNTVPFPAADINGSTVAILLYDAPSKYREAAGFVDLTAHITSRLDVILGARESGNYQSFAQAEGGVLGVVTTAEGGSPGGRSRQDVTTYLVNPRFHIDKDSIIYARAASGYRPGGPNIIIPPPFPAGPATFKPDTLWNYEVGTKSTFLDRKLAIDFDIYYIDWKDIQLIVSSDGLNRIENGGRAAVRGAELAGAYKIIRGLTFGGNMSYSHAKLAEATPELDAGSGAPLPFSPRFSAAATLDYSHALTDWLQGSAGVSYRFVGQRPSGYDGSTVDPNYWLPSYDVIDLRFGLQTNFVTVAFLLKNVLNNLGQVAGGSVAEYNATAPVRATIIQPRTIGLTLTFGL